MEAPKRFDRDPSTHSQLPTQAMAETARIFCNPEENPRAHAAALDQTVRLHYQSLRAGEEKSTGGPNRVIYMDEHDPIRYEYNVARAVWNALAAPIVHAIEVDLIEYTLPRLQSGHPLITSEIVGVDFDRFFTVPYEDQALLFMRAANAWAAGAAERVMRQIENDRTHWARPLWELFCERHPQFCWLETQAKGRRRTYSPYWEIMSNSLDANATAWSVLGPLFRHLREHRGIESADMQQALLARVEELSWAASITGNTLDSLAPRTMGDTCSFSHTASRGLWRIGSLQEGPWPIERYCPANIEVALAQLEARQAVDTWFADAASNSERPSRHYARLAGGGKAAEMRLIFGVHLLGELA